MKIIFENPEETNDPEKVNKALQEISLNARQYADQNNGILSITNEIVTADSNIGSQRAIIEHNDENKRIVLNIDGKNYKIDLTEIT